MKKAADSTVSGTSDLEEDEEEVNGKVLGYGGDEARIMSVVSPRGLVSVSSLGYFSSIDSSFKHYHSSFTLSLRARHIQEYFKKKRGRNFIKTQHDKDRRGEQRKKMRVTVRAKLVVRFWVLITLVSVSDNSSGQDSVTVTKENEDQVEEEPEAKQNMTSFRVVLERRA